MGEVRVLVPLTKCVSYTAIARRVPLLLRKRRRLGVAARREVEQAAACHHEAERVSTLCEVVISQPNRCEGTVEDEARFGEVAPLQREQLQVFNKSCSSFVHLHVLLGPHCVG